MTLDEALEELLVLAEEEQTLLASWSRYDPRVIGTFAASDVYDRIADVWTDAKDVARRWYRVFDSPFVLPEGSGKHKLSAYASYFDAAHPQKYGMNVAATGVRAMESALSESGAYSLVDSAARTAWKAMLGHNHLDCCATYQVAVRCAEELEQD